MILPPKWQNPSYMKIFMSIVAVGGRSKMGELLHFKDKGIELIMDDS